MKTNNKKRLQTIGQKISSFRKTLDLTQEELAIKANISYSYITKIEAPNTYLPFSIETLFDIADALNVEPKDLL